MNRRDFIKNTATLAAVQTIPAALNAKEKKEESAKAPKDPEENVGPLIDSAPVLQNYASESMGIAFGVSARANGYVVYGKKPNLSDGKKVYCGGYRLTDMNEHVMQIRLTGLEPDTTYYYKIGADRIHYGGGYDMKILGTEIDPKIYSFRTAGKGAAGHFCVINDTHAWWDTFGVLMNKIGELKPECVIWNGDACNTQETIESVKEIFINPPIERRDFAAETPFLLCSGNHDMRGLANRQLERIWMYRQPEERSSRDWDLGRNFAVRMGDIAMIGLDTGEDKQDTNPRFANLFCSTPYRKAQAVWLKDVLKRKEIASAPFLVTFCHIPLFDDNPTANPGDIAPADTDSRYSANFAAWQRECQKLWMPLLEKAGCQLVICAHQHEYKYFAATKERPWAQIVGGGPDLNVKRRNRFPTIIEGLVEGKQLLIRVHNMQSQLVQDEYRFERR